MSQPALRIAHIVECFGGGVSTYLRLVLPRLAQRGFVLTLICSLNRDDPSAASTLKHLGQQGIHIRMVPMTRSINPLSDIPACFRLAMIFLKNHFDIVHTHGSKAGALGRLAAWFTGIDLRLHTPHCFAHLRCRSTLARCLFLNLERCLGKITTTLLAVSPSEAAIAIKQNIITSKKCAVILNALPSDSQVGRAMPAIGHFTVTTITRAGSGKGLARFLDLAESWPYPNTRFLIAGLRRPADIPPNPYVQWLGFRHDIENIYQLSDVIVLASDAEGRSYALLEAMRAGCAVLATNVPGNSDLIRHDQTGLLASTDNPSLTAELTRLYRNPNLRQRLGSNARRDSVANHNLDHQINRLMAIYDQSSQY